MSTLMKATKILFPAAILVTIMLFLSLPSDAEETCRDPANEPALDKAVFDVFGCSSEWRTWFRQAFNLQESHWDEGWGWSQCSNLFREFGRMSTAGQVITNGVSEGIQKWWPQSFTQSGTANPGASRTTAVFKDDELHLFYSPIYGITVSQIAGDYFYFIELFLW